MTLIKYKSSSRLISFWLATQILFSESVTQIAKQITFTLPKELKLIYFQMRITKISNERAKA